MTAPRPAGTHRLALGGAALVLLVVLLHRLPLHLRHEHLVGGEVLGLRAAAAGGGRGLGGLVVVVWGGGRLVKTDRQGRGDQGTPGKKRPGSGHTQAHRQYRQAHRGTLSAAMVGGWWWWWWLSVCLGGKGWNGEVYISGGGGESVSGESQLFKESGRAWRSASGTRTRAPGIQFIRPSTPTLKSIASSH